MLKKDQVLEALENGGCIMVDSIYRTARVLDADNNEIDTCRYDTAERIERGEGYTKTYRGGWYATWYIEKEQATQEEAQEEAPTLEDMKEATTDALRVFETAGVISDLTIEPLTADQVAELTAQAAAQEEDLEAQSARVYEAVQPFAEAISQANIEAAQEEQPAEDERTPWERVTAKNPDCPNAWRLPGYPGPLWRLEYTKGGFRTSYYPTLREMQDDLEALPKVGGYDFKAAHRANSASEWEEIPAETRQEQTDRENRETCRRIAEDLESYASGSAYKCPHCREVHDMGEYEETEHENADGYTCYTCPNCGEDIEEDDLEAVSLYDYFEDCLDIEYRVTGRARDSLRSVRVMVTCGGPNIYIDTQSKAVELYWWGDRASYPIAYDAVDAVDEWAAEYWSCL